MKRLAVVAMMTMAAIQARGEDLGSAVAAMPCSLQAQVASVPGDVLDSLQAISDAVDDVRSGRDPRSAGRDYTSAIQALAGSKRGLAGLESEAFATALILEAEVLFLEHDGTRALLPPAERRAVDGAINDWRIATVEMVRMRLHAGPDGPDRPCLAQYLECNDYCSNQRTFLTRAACGLDCEIELLGCMGDNLGRPFLKLAEYIVTK